MNIHIDINALFADLHEKHRNGTLTREQYDSNLRTMLVAAGKLPGRATFKTGNTTLEAEQSGCLSYTWQPGGTLSISFRTPWDGQHRLNGFPRHLRQAARVELDSSMTDMEAAKLRVARAAGDAVYEAVMDDLLCCRAEDMLQRQGPDAKRAVNIDERYRLGDNPDVIAREDLPALVHGARDDDRER